MEEIWKDIKGYEGLYQISDLGRVKSLERKRECGYGKQCLVKCKVLKFNVGKNGYLYVNLSKNGCEKHYYVHRLVAKHFIPNPNNYNEINHKDENKSNNFVKNLEWCTHKENMNYGSLKNKIIQTKTKQLGKPINQYDLNNNLIKGWESSHQIERVLKIPHQNIIRCCKNKVKTAGGYKWKYKTEYNVANAIFN